MFRHIVDIINKDLQIHNHVSRDAAEKIVAYINGLEKHVIKFDFKSARSEDSTFTVTCSNIEFLKECIEKFKHENENDTQINHGIKFYISSNMYRIPLDVCEKIIIFFNTIEECRFEKSLKDVVEEMHNRMQKEHLKRLVKKHMNLQKKMIPRKI